MKKIIKFNFAGLVLALCFSVQSCNTANNAANKIDKAPPPVEEAITTEKVENSVGTNLVSELKGTWTLVTIEGTAASDAFKGTIPYITFDADNHRVSGNAGCNRFMGGYTLSGSVYEPSMPATTQMACFQENQESKLLKLLGQKSSLVFNGSTLQFVQEGRVVLEFNLPRKQSNFNTRKRRKPEFSQMSEL